MPRVKSVPKKTENVEGETIVTKAGKMVKKVADNIPKEVKEKVGKKVKEVASDKAIQIADKALERMKLHAGKMVDKYSGHSPYGRDLLAHIDKYSRKKFREMVKGENSNEQKSV